MKEPLGTAYASLREELDKRIVEAVWPTPEAGFLSYLLGDSGSPRRPKVVPTNKRLTEAPILASNGYLYGASSNSSSPVMDVEWTTALGKLLQRDPFPVDRESYFFRPFEILGICLGAKSCTSVSADAKEKLRTILQMGQPRIAETDLWGYSLTSFGAWQLGLSWKRQSLPLLENLTLDELCLLRWLSGQGHFSRESGLECRADVLDGHILSQCFVRMNLIVNPAQAAVTILVTEQLVNERISSDLERTWAAPANTLAAENLVGAICRRFHTFAKQIVDRHDERATIEIKDEYDVQDLFHALLKLHFEDVRAEEWTPSYGGSSTRMDFLLKREKVVVEVKMTRKGLDQKGVVRELTEDIERYRAHPDCKTLVCFVYDPSGLCTNRVALEDDLTGPRGTVRIVVLVAPKS